MKPRPNWKLVAWVCGSLIVPGIVVHLLHAVQVRRSARILLPEIRAAEERGDGAAMARYLGQYLELAPGDLDVLARYGAALARLPAPAAHTRALAAFEQVLQRQPDRDDVRRQLIRVALDAGRISDAQKHLAILLKASPEEAELEDWLGQCEEANKLYPRAIAAYEKAIRLDPQRIGAYVRLARLQRLRLNRPDRADRLMDNLVTANAEAYQAYLERGRYRTEWGALDEAGRDLARARELAPRGSAVFLATAEWARARGKLDEARTWLQRGSELGPRDARLFLVLSDVEARAGKRRAAVACLHEGLQAFPEQLDLLLALVELLLQDNAQAESSIVIARLNQAGCSPDLINYLHGRLLALQGRWVEAVRLLEQVRSRAPTSDWLDRAELCLGDCYEQLADPERQLATYHRAVDRDPRCARLRLALAATLASQGRSEEAVTAYWQAVSLPDVPADAWLQLGRALLQDNLLRPLRFRQWDRTEQVLQQAAQASPGTVDLALLRADVFAAQERLDEAREVLRQARAEHPASPEVSVSLATLLERQGQGEEAWRLLQEARRQLGDPVELRLACARYWVRRGTSEVPARLAESTRDLEKLPATEQVQLLHGLAEIYANLGDRRAANRLLAQVAEWQPCDLTVRLLLFDAALKDEEDAMAKHWLEEIRRIEGADGALWRYAEAARDVQRARHGDRSALAEARRRLSEAGERRRSWSRVPLLTAHLDELEGKPREALINYRHAIALGDRQPDVRQRVAQLQAEHR